MANDPIGAALARLSGGAAPAPTTAAVPQRVAAPPGGTDRISQALANLSSVNSRSAGLSSSGPPPLTLGAPGPALPRAPKQQAQKGGQKQKNLSSSAFGKLAPQDKIAYLNSKTGKGNGLLSTLDNAAVKGFAEPLQTAVHGLGYGAAAVGATAAGGVRKISNDLQAAAKGDFGAQSQMQRDQANGAQIIKDTKAQTGTGQYLERSTKNGANPVLKDITQAVGVVPAALQHLPSAIGREVQGAKQGDLGSIVKLTSAIGTLGLAAPVAAATDPQYRKDVSKDSLARGKQVVGAAGDVVRDPLTWLAPEAGLSGAAADRSTLAARFAEQGAVDALGADGAKAAAEKVLRGGTGALSSDELAAVGQKGGLYLGHGDHQLQVLPHEVSSTLSAPFRAGKTALSDAFDSRLGVSDALRSQGSQGEVDLAKMARAGNVDANLQRRALKGAEIGATSRVMPEGHALADALKGLQPQDDQLARQALEGNISAQKELTAKYGTEAGIAQRDAAGALIHNDAAPHTQLRQALDNMLGLAHDSSDHLGSLGVNAPKVGTIEDYFPRRLTDEAKTILAETGQKPTAGDVLLKSRSLKPGESFMGEVIPQGTPDAQRAFVNQVFEAKTGSQFYDDQSFRKILGSYAQSVKNHVQNNLLAAREIQTGVRTLDPAVAAKDAAMADAATARKAAVTAAQAPPSDAALQAEKAGLQQQQTVAGGSLGSALGGASPGQAINPEAGIQARIDQINEQLAQHGNQPGLVDQANHLQDAQKFQHLVGKTANPVEKSALSIEAQASAKEADLAAAGTRPLTPAAVRVNLGNANTVKGLLDASSEQAKHELSQFPRDPEIQAAVDKIDALRANPKQATNWWMKQGDKALTWMKSAQIASPGFNAKVGLGVVWNVGMLQGADLSSLKAAIAAQEAFGTREGWAAFSAANPEVAKAWEDVQPLAGRTQIQSVIPHGEDQLTGQSTKASLLQKINPLSSRNAIFDLQRKVGTSVEQLGRAWSGMDVILKGGNQEDAYAAVNKYLFDYGAKSPLEKNAVSRAVPFYTWQRRNIPLQLQSLAEKPKAFSIYNDVAQNVAPGQKALPGTPDYVTKDALGIPLKPNAKGEQKFITPPLPLKDIANNPLTGGLTGALDFALSPVTPIVKTPLEAYFHTQAFKRLPLSDKEAPAPSAWTKIPGLMQGLHTIGLANKRGSTWAMSQKSAYMVEQYLPPLARIRRLAPSEPNYQAKQATSTQSFLAGGVSRTVTQKDRDTAAYFANKAKQTTLKNQLKTP